MVGVPTTADEVVDDKARLFGDVVESRVELALLFAAGLPEVESPEGKLASTDNQQGAWWWWPEKQGTSRASCSTLEHGPDGVA